MRVRLTKYLDGSSSSIVRIEAWKTTCQWAWAAAQYHARQNVTLFDPRSKYAFVRVRAVYHSLRATCCPDGYNRM